MKNLFLAVLTVLLASCSSEDDNLQISQNRVAESTQSVNVTPVRLSSWVYSRSKGKHLINFQWLSDYGYPFLAYTPHYVTIYKNGVLVEDFVQRPFNQYSIEVTSSWSATYQITITQTVIGVGTSEPMTFNTYRQY